MLVQAVAALLLNGQQVNAQDGLQQLLIKLNPPRNIDNEKWAQLTFSERVAQYDYTLEKIVALIAVVFFTFQFFTRRYNRNWVNKCMDHLEPVLTKEFAEVGVGHGKLLTTDAPHRFTTYASGRENVEYLLARFRLNDRQNIVPFVSSFFMSSLGSSDSEGDHIDFTIRPILKSKVPAGIFSVLNKDYLGSCQENCYFLKLTKISENKLLPSPIFTVMQEHGDQAVKLLTPTLISALSAPGADKILRQLVISDVSADEPKDITDFKYDPVVILSISMPKTSAEYEAASLLVEAALNWVDVLTEGEGYNPSAVKKITANREQEQVKFNKLLEAKKQEEIEQKKAEERREAARKEMKLSNKEQRALQKKEQAKQARKQRHKMNKKA